MMFADNIDAVRSWRWGQPPGVPWACPGLPDKINIGPEWGQTDCSTWLAWCLLDKLKPVSPVGVYAALQIFDRKRPWSGVQAVQHYGLGVGLLGRWEDAHVGQWLIAQSWRGLVDGAVVRGSSGHARLCQLTLPGAMTVYDISRSKGGLRITHNVTQSHVAKWGDETRFAALFEPYGRDQCR